MFEHLFFFSENLAYAVGQTVAIFFHVLIYWALVSFLMGGVIINVIRLLWNQIQINRNLGYRNFQNLLKDKAAVKTHLKPRHALMVLARGFVQGFWEYSLNFYFLQWHEFPNQFMSLREMNERIWRTLDNSGPVVYEKYRRKIRVMPDED